MKNLIALVFCLSGAVGIYIIDTFKFTKREVPKHTILLEELRVWNSNYNRVEDNCTTINVIDNNKSEDKND